MGNLHQSLLGRECQPKSIKSNDFEYTVVATWIASDGEGELVIAMISSFGYPRVDRFIDVEFLPALDPFTAQ